MKHVYLLIEEINRELLSRLLVSRYAVERGCTVLLGPQWWFAQNFHALPPGVALFKGNNAVQANFMAQARRHGHRVATIDEESFGATDGGQIVREYDRRAIDLADALFLQGDFQRAVLQGAHGDQPGKFLLVGNPRVDLLALPAFHPTDRLVEAYRAERGRYLLVSTNYTTINPRFEDTLTYLETCQRVGVLDATRPADRDRFVMWCDWERANLRAVVGAIHRLRAELPDLRIVIRPHPSERRAPWVEAFGGKDGVDVIGEGNHLAWILGSEALLHSGCSTGLEAFLIKRAAVSLAPGDSIWPDSSLSNFVNPFFREPDAAVAAICQHVRGERDLTDDAAEAHRRLNHYMLTDTVDGRHGGAADRIARHLADMAPETSPRDDGTLPLRAELLPLDASPRMQNKSFVDQAGFAERLGAVCRATDRRAPIAVTPAGGSVFVLAADAAARAPLPAVPAH